MKDQPQCEKAGHSAKCNVVNDYVQPAHFHRKMAEQRATEEEDGTVDWTHNRKRGINREVFQKDTSCIHAVKVCCGKLHKHLRPNTQN